MDRYQQTIDKTSVIRRFLVPVKADDFIPGRSRCWGLTPHDFGLVTEGYACSSCLACWQPAILDECPVCGEQRQQVVERPDWSAYDKYVKHELENPTRTEITPMHKLVEEATAEQVGEWKPGVKRNL